MIGGDANELCHWDLRRGTYGATRRVKVCADMGGGDACELWHWDLRWISYGATQRVRGVPT
eukprot:8466683-Pyramimonas_sp.AAC.1